MPQPKTRQHLLQFHTLRPLPLPRPHNRMIKQPTIRIQPRIIPPPLPPGRKPIRHPAPIKLLPFLQRPAQLIRSRLRFRVGVVFYVCV